MISVNGMRDSYGLGSYTASVLSGGISFDGVPGDGRGQTIAIVDAYDYPTAFNDVNAFSNNFGLPTFTTINSGSGSPIFQQLNQNGQPVSRVATSANYVPTDPNGPGSSDWENEEALDIEWAHAIAPMANIDLIEASDDSNSNLFAAVNAANNIPGVVCVSMSWGGEELGVTAAQEATFDSTDLTTPAGHMGGSATMGGTELSGGITYFVAAGDAGAYGSVFSTSPEPDYPSDSPNVVSVGGTALIVGGSSPNYTYGSETAWGNGTNSATEGGGGGGVSLYEKQPSYQKGIVNKYSTIHRTTPDVAMEASPATLTNLNEGVPVYDTYDNGTVDPWFEGVGGTSLASPMWAALVSIADEGRAIAGLGSLNGLTQTLPELYSLPAADFHDITSGSTGPAPFSAGPGYDLTTGLGSPVGNLLVPGLINYVPTVTGISPAGGSSAGGTTVTVTGTNFNGATVVDFGSTPATNVVDVSATEITCTSPAGTGNVYVTVTGPGGVSATSSASQFAYSTAPVVTAVTPPAAPLAGGTTVTITGANFTGATAVDFGTLAATHFTIVSSAEITATVPAGTGTVDVTVVTPLGTSATSPADQLTYDGAATVTAVSPANGASAGGTLVTITGTNLAGATLVDFGTKAGTIKSDTPTQITVLSPAGSGTVDITVTDPGGTSTTGASDKFTYVPPPTVATAASATPSPVNGLTTNLSVFGADALGEPTLTYTWSATGPSGAAAPTYSSNGTNASKNSTATFSQAGSYTFTVTISDDSGQSVTSSVNVTVEQTLTKIAVTPPNPSIYENQTQQFTATALDQFGIAMATQPTITWSEQSGVGSISSTGLFSSPSAMVRRSLQLLAGR